MARCQQQQGAMLRAIPGMQQGCTQAAAAYKILHRKQKENPNDGQAAKLIAHDRLAGACR